MRAKHLLILTLVAGLATLSAITAASTAPLVTASVEPSRLPQDDHATAGGETAGEEGRQVHR